MPYDLDTYACYNTLENAPCQYVDFAGPSCYSNTLSLIWDDYNDDIEKPVILIKLVTRFPNFEALKLARLNGPLLVDFTPLKLIYFLANAKLISLFPNYINRFEVEG